MSTFAPTLSAFDAGRDEGRHLSLPYLFNQVRVSGFGFRVSGVGFSRRSVSTYAVALLTFAKK